MNREGGALDTTQGTGPTHRPLPVCASLPLYRDRHEQHHERHHEQHMTGTMSQPLFADGLSRNRPPEFATITACPSKDASNAICGASPATKRRVA